jgi:hypothetical protein
VVAIRLTFIVLAAVSLALAQQGPPAYFEVTTIYDSQYVNGNNGYLSVNYCAGTAYGPFGDAKCELQGPPPKFMTALTAAGTSGGLSFDTTGYGPGIFTENISLGPNTVSGSLKSSYSWDTVPGLNDNWSLNLVTTIKTYVRGLSGTKFHLDYSVAESAQAAVTKLTCANGSLSAGFSGPQAISVSTNSEGDSKSQNVTFSPAGGIDGVSGSTTRSYLGQTYTLANTLSIVSGANTGDGNRCPGFTSEFSGQAAS